MSGTDAQLDMFGGAQALEDVAPAPALERPAPIAEALTLELGPIAEVRTIRGAGGSVTIETVGMF